MRKFLQGLIAGLAILPVRPRAAPALLVEVEDQEQIAENAFGEHFTAQLADPSKYGGMTVPITEQRAGTGRFRNTAVLSCAELRAELEAFVESRSR